MNPFLILTTLLPLANSSPSYSQSSPSPTLQGPFQKASTRALQTDSNAYSTPDYTLSNLNPLPSASVSYGNDDGHLEAISHITIWTTCPRRHLDCRRCPRDRRCLRSGPKPIPPPFVSSSAQPRSTPVYKPRPHPYLTPSLWEPAALTGPQLEPIPGIVPQAAESGSETGTTDCRLSKCGKTVNACGKGANCVGDYCACRDGMKSSSDGVMGRGWDVPESANVYVDVGVDCDQICNQLLCTEVKVLVGCFGNAVGPDELETTSTAGHGAIQVPGADGIYGNGSLPIASGGTGDSCGTN